MQLARYNQILATALLIALAAMLPFELARPLILLGPFSITNVEAILYIVLALWLSHVIFTRRLRWSGLHAAVIGCILAIVLAALFAPFEQTAAWKFTLRSLSGYALFFAAADFLNTPARIRIVLTTLVIATLLSALATFVEISIPASHPFLLLFKTRIFNVGEYTRAGGTFEYPNTAAMFWEAMLPVAIGLASWRSIEKADTRSSMRGMLLAATATAIFTQAILLSASRAALVGVGLALLASLLISWRVMPEVRRAVIICIVSALIVLIGNVIASPLTALRFQSESNDSWFRGEIKPAIQAIQLDSSARMTLTVVVRNTSIVMWRATGTQPVSLSYHWLDALTRKSIVRDGVRTVLPHDLAPGAEISLQAGIVAPDKAGQFILQWDLLQEHIAWFSQYGNPTIDVTAQVRSGLGPPIAVTPTQSIEVTARIEPSRRELWMAAIQMWQAHPVFGIGPDNFRHTYGPYLGLTEFNSAIHTNNWYIETLTNAGLVGAFALAILLWVLLRTLWRILSKPNVDFDRLARPNRWLLLCVLIGLLTYFAHGLLDYFFEFTPTYGLFWLLMGIVAGLSAKSSEAKEAAFAHPT